VFVVFDSVIFILNLEFVAWLKLKQAVLIKNILKFKLIVLTLLIRCKRKILFRSYVLKLDWLEEMKIQMSDFVIQTDIIIYFIFHKFYQAIDIFSSTNTVFNRLLDLVNNLLLNLVLKGW
jgi:hypothetical protein